jgi:hypothetical protein
LDALFSGALPCIAEMKIPPGEPGGIRSGWFAL